MEPPDEDLTDIETQLRELAAQDRARTEDADLLARLMQQADAACGSPRTRVRSLWLRISAIAAGVAVLATVPFFWSGQEAPLAAGGAENLPVDGAASAPVLAAAELAPAGEALPVALAMEAAPSAAYDALPQAAGGMPQDAVAVGRAEATAGTAAEAEPADNDSFGDAVRALAVAVYSGAAEEEADMDADADDGEIPPWLCETETAPAPESLAVAQPVSVPPQQMQPRAWGVPQERVAHHKAVNCKAKRTKAPLPHSPAALPSALKAYAARIRAHAQRAQQ